MNAKDKGFALKLRVLAFDDTLKIAYNKRDLAEIMEISQPTLRKKLKSIEMVYQDGFVAEYFPVCERCYLTDSNVQYVKDVLCSDKTSKTYKQVAWFLGNGLHKRRDANKRLMNIMAGLVGQKKKEVKYE